eukprot:scaffold91881_cov14-Tisochrysis_lutea.AAC.1
MEWGRLMAAYQIALSIARWPASQCLAPWFPCWCYLESPQVTLSTHLTLCCYYMRVSAAGAAAPHDHRQRRSRAQAAGHGLGEPVLHA